MLKAYKYRIYPNDEQKTMLAKTFGCTRVVYNWAFATHEREYAETGKKFDKRELKNRIVSELKPEKTWLKEVNSQALQAILQDADATIYTLEDSQIHDFDDMNSGLLHSLKYAIDAMYVKQQSINGRKTHELRVLRRELSAKDVSFGYVWHKDTRTILVNEDEAQTVRLMYYMPSRRKS